MVKVVYTGGYNYGGYWFCLWSLVGGAQRVVPIDFVRGGRVFGLE